MKTARADKLPIKNSNGKARAVITVISGKLASGKSYHCVLKVRDHLAKGGCVRTNIRLDTEQIGRYVGRRLSPRQVGLVSAEDDPTEIPTGDRRGHGSRRTIVLLDEALNWFQSTVGSKDSRKFSWSEWLRQSDKLGQDVWFVAQNFERAAKWIRELAQVSIEIFPLRDLKIGMIFPVWLLFPPMRNMYCAKYRDVRSGLVVKLEFHRYSSDVWDLYDTSETFGFVGAASAYDSVNLWPRYRSPLWAFGASLFVFALSIVSVSLLLFF